MAANFTEQEDQLRELQQSALRKTGAGKSKVKQRQTQRDRIFRLLQSRAGQWVPLYEITPLAAQYNARIKELRDDGHPIENRTEHHDGKVHSWFRLPVPTGQVPLFTVGLEYEQRRHYLETTSRRL